MGKKKSNFVSTVFSKNNKDKIVKTTNKKVKQNNDIPDVYWATIKDRYIFDKDKTNDKYHSYAIYTDMETKENRVIQSHHLYKPDKKNMEKVKNGLLLKVKTTMHETPSGLDSYYYNKTVNGKSIDFKNVDVISIDKTPINKKLAKQIVEFAKKANK